jgi:DNA-binding cell septation regulator SpoVG
VKKMFSYTIKTYPVKNPKSKIVAYASLVIENVFEVTGFKIFNGSNGLFVKPPQHKGKNKDGEDEWYDDARFVGEQSKEVREEIFTAMVQAYNTNAANSSRSTTANLHNNINEQQAPKSTTRALW